MCPSEKPIPARPSKRAFRRPFWLFTAATAAVLGGHVLGLFNPKPQTPPIKHFSAAVGTSRVPIDLTAIHADETPRPRLTYDVKRVKTASGSVNLGFPDVIDCRKCHDMHDLPISMANELLAKDRAVRDLFPPDGIHSNLEDAFVSFPPLRYYRGESEKIGHSHAGTAAHGIDFKLPFVVPQYVRDTIYGHELTHFHTSCPEDYLAEMWAAPASFFLSKNKASSKSDSWNNFSKFVGLMQRAALLHDRLSGPLEPNLDHDSGARALRQLLGYVHDEHLDTLKPLFKEAFSQYRRNNLFWDAAAFEYQNPWLPLDVQVARKMFQQKHPRLMEQLAYPRVVQGDANGFRAAGEDILRERLAFKRPTSFRPVDYAAEKLDKVGVDIRNMFCVQNARELPQAVSDAIYYAAIFQTFCHPDGRLKYSAVTTREFRKHASEKLARLDVYLKYARVWVHGQPGLENPGNRFFMKRFSISISAAKSRRAELKRALRTGRFVRP
ncbi:hypothetical protein HY994_00340 [Candidatus Micrarchaeota archaeon]|nr:hypothetical protein [Candidatus Micrarchaeota archaeon]